MQCFCILNRRHALWCKTGPEDFWRKKLTAVCKCISFNFFAWLRILLEWLPCFLSISKNQKKSYEPLPEQFAKTRATTAKSQTKSSNFKLLISWNYLLRQLPSCSCLSFVFVGVPGPRNSHREERFFFWQPVSLNFRKLWARDDRYILLQAHSHI